MKDLQNDFYYILERFGNRSYICGANSKSKTKTGIKTFEENSRGMERDNVTHILATMFVPGVWLVNNSCEVYEADDGEFNIYFGDCVVSVEATYFMELGI